MAYCRAAALAGERSMADCVAQMRKILIRLSRYRQVGGNEVV